MNNNNNHKVRIKFDTESMRYAGLFETMTGSPVKDCIINSEQNKLIFVVKEGSAGLAIGRNGINIKNLQKILNKKIEVLEFSSDIVKFIENIFRPLKVRNVYISEKSDGKKVVRIETQKSRALARVKLKKTKLLLKKYFNIDEITFV